ncbi:hypothetical protein [Aeromicrobium fastidiosum]|uniref:Sensor domain-containing protein n=1 Tax=Aeromicrobium fastidiosum TaxID=52699 RepID=A0A641ATD4_9ACTN|nr:hypothetical protein [Aeromicrobium fastidiosum]KAA1380311.1 hypothetical protein ESP62_003705 [Aeromicrobium fastidiosum]MBP2389867.1 hypothetical protein [Aeromicrobium fastidiosum]
MPTTDVLTKGVAALGVLLVVGGCGGGGTRGVLTEDDVPRVESVADTFEGIGVAPCSRLTIAERRIRLDNGSADRDRRLILHSNEVVGSSANGVDRRFADAAAALALVDSAIDYCSSREPLPSTTVERLDGLPAAAYGYRATVRSVSRHMVLTRVFAPHGDEVVIVSTRGTGDDRPTVDAVDLLPTALERADELD